MNMLKRLKSGDDRSQQRRGAILVFAAFMIIMVFALAAFAIDLSYLSMTKTQLQNAADAAALAGALELTDAYTDVRSAVEAVAALNKAAGYSVTVQDQDVVLGTWDASSATFTPLSGAGEANADAVQVTCYLSSARGTPLNLFFAPLIGSAQGSLTTTAIATIQNSRCGLIIGLSSVTMSGGSFTDSYNAAQGAYVAGSGGNKGTVCSNGSMSLSGPSIINGDAHPGPAGTVTCTGSSGVTGKTTPLSKTMSFPSISPGSAATVNNNNNIPISDLGKHPLDSQNNFTLSGGDGVTLPPGTYYFAKMTLSGGSSIRINGATTIYATGDVDLSGGSVANLTTLPKNLQLFPSGQKCNISGSSTFYGVVYGPNTAVIRSGSSGYFGSIVGSSLTLSGSGGIHADVSLDFSYLGAGSSTGTLVK